MLHPFYSWLRPSGYSWAGTAYEPLLTWAPLHLFTLFHERQPVWEPSRCSVCFWLLSHAAGRTRSNALSMSCCSIVRLPYYAAHTKVRSPSQHVATALAAHGDCAADQWGCFVHHSGSGGSAACCQTHTVCRSVCVSVCISGNVFVSLSACGSLCLNICECASLSLCERMCGCLSLILCMCVKAVILVLLFIIIIIITINYTSAISISCVYICVCVSTVTCMIDRSPARLY